MIAPRLQDLPGSDALLGTDGNAYAIMGLTFRVLRRAGADSEFVAAVQAKATGGDYNVLLATCMAALDGEAI